MSRQIDAAMFVDLESANGRGLSARRFSAERLINLAEEDFDAKLRVAAAYADFRYYQQFIEVLHLTGFEAVQVTGYRPGQQSVDMKMCCDILGIAYERPEIKMFVILANDTDYVPLVRLLRKLGRSIFLLCKKSESIEQAYGAFCDRIVDYGMLIEDSSVQAQAAADVATESQTQVEGGVVAEQTGEAPVVRSEHEVAALYRRAQEELKEMLAEYPAGLLGAQLLPQMRIRLAMPSFDFSDVGYGSALKFVRSMSASDISIVHDGRPDFLVVGEAGNVESSSDKVEWVRRNSAIKEYAFNPDRNNRKQLVDRLFATAKKMEPFTRRELIDRIQADSPTNTKAEIDKYYSVFAQMQAFDRVIDEAPARFVVKPDFTADNILARFDTGLTYKALFALNRAGRLDEWGVQEQCELFGLTGLADAKAIAQGMIDAARERLNAVLEDQPGA